MSETLKPDKLDELLSLLPEGSGFFIKSEINDKLTFYKKESSSSIGYSWIIIQNNHFKDLKRLFSTETPK